MSARPAADSTSFLVANVVDFIHESDCLSCQKKRSKSPKFKNQCRPSLSSSFALEITSLSVRFRDCIARIIFLPSEQPLPKDLGGPISDYPPCSHALDALGARWHHACLQQTMVGCVNTLTELNFESVDESDSLFSNMSTIFPYAQFSPPPPLLIATCEISSIRSLGLGTPP